jgi:soluble lytic murein transglycosylase
VLSAATQNAQRFLDKHALNLKTRAGREAAIYALARLARSDALAAVDAWSGKQDAFSEAERGYVWSMLAYRGAQDHEARALAWFRQAGNALLSEEQAAWKVRAALRLQDWNEVLAAIGAMTTTQASDPAWRYWKARALLATNEGAQANALFVELSKQFNFYGLLAREELGPVLSNPREPWKAGEAEVSTVESAPGLKRALTLHRLGLTEEAREEWRFAVRAFDDKQLLTAAEIARRANWYDRMISAADKTTSVHDFSMRYPVPYREALESGARSQQLDEAWVFGLVRQESRFIADARSSAGAMGLMQIMPATARWAAQRMGLGKFSTGEIREVEMNASLGSYYLKHVLAELGHPVLATAAYNAGPNRARRWTDAKPMEGAIYAETIPFTETRDYVKKVMANASVYAAQFGHKLLSLKERLGTIPARDGGNVAGSFQ